MNDSVRAWSFAGLSKGFLLGTLWGAAAAGIESILVNHSMGTGLQRPISLLELMANYALYAGIAVVVLQLAAELIRRFRGAAGRRVDGTAFAEALVGSALWVAALATYLQKGPWGALPLTWTLALILGIGGIVATALLTMAIRRLSPGAMKAVRAALVVCIIAGFVWVPLFGPYTGMLRSREIKTVPPRPVNVLLILIDTLRADYLGSYGSTSGASPVIDRLAATGALFEKNIGQCTWTLPATTSVLTGLFPSSHGAVATGMSVASPVPTLSEVLNQSGYRTAAFTENAYIRPQFGFGRGFDYFWTYWLPWVFDGTAVMRVVNRLHLPKIEFTNKHAYVTIPHIHGPEGVNWDARAAADACLEWLEGDSQAPFLAYVHFMGPHGPYGPREYLLDGDAPSKRLTDFPRPMGGAYPLNDPAGEATPEETDHMKLLYTADIRCVDFHIGRILDWLETNGKLSDTMVIVTADHGEEFQEHGSWNHGSSAFTEVGRVPFILNHGGTVPAGVRVDRVTRQIDLMPTVLDYLGLDCPEGVQGRSVRPLVDGAGLDPLPAFVEVYPAVPSNTDIVALVNERHKVVRVTRDDRSAILLYDLISDPAELDNLAESYPALRDSLLTEMEKWDQIARANSPIDPTRLKYFRSLGYINQ